MHAQNPMNITARTPWRLIIALLLTVSGCSFDKLSGGVLPFQAMTNAVDGTTGAGAGILIFDYTVTGTPGTVVDLLAEYSLPVPVVDAQGPALPATPAPSGFGPQFASTPLTNIILPGSGAATGRFCWYWAGDLGFVGTTGVVFTLTPINSANSQSGGSANSGALNYGGGVVGNGGPNGSSGSASGGRAAHVAAFVGGAGPQGRVIVAGGNTPGGPTDTITRYNVDANAFTHTAAFTGQMVNPRLGHAAAFFIDPTTHATRILVCGGTTNGAVGTATLTADVYAFTPTEQVTSTPSIGAMNTARTDHTATWIGSNKVIIIGGRNTLNQAIGSIEIFDPATGLFSVAAATLATPRAEHTATLLPNGNILVAGGTFGSATEIYDPRTDSMVATTLPTFDRRGHSATRLANGWVLLAGGHVSNVADSLLNPTSNAVIFMPELGTTGAFTSTVLTMGTARTTHTATLLGNGRVLVAGGDTNSGETGSAEIFLPESLLFTPVGSMGTARAKHSATSLANGTVVIIDGQANSASTFLSSIELFAVQNQMPTVTTVTPTATAGGVMLAVTVTDPDQDGGYVIIRHAPVNTTNYSQTIIDQQVPSSSTNPGNLTFATMRVLPGTTMFRVPYAANGLSAGQQITFKVDVVGAVISPAAASTTTTLP